MNSFTNIKDTCTHFTDQYMKFTVTHVTISY